MAAAGVNHMILAITDPAIVKAFACSELENVADVKGQLGLVHDEVTPALR